MNRATLLEHLARAERHIAEGAERLARQQELIDRLTNHNHDTAWAQALLRTMRETQANHIADRDRLVRQLE
jgi:hypothetical protein